MKLLVWSVLSLILYPKVSDLAVEQLHSSKKPEVKVAAGKLKTVASKIHAVTHKFLVIGPNFAAYGRTSPPVFQWQSFFGTSYPITGAILHRANNSGKRRLSIHALETFKIVSPL